MAEWFQATKDLGLTGRARLLSLRRHLRSKGWEWNKNPVLMTTEELDEEVK